MRLQRKNRPFGDVDLSAFPDIAFLLIIFFVLTTTFVKYMGVGTNIPDSTSDTEQKTEHEIPTISLTRESIYLNEQAMSMEDIRRALAEMNLSGRVEEERAIIVESAPDVGYDRYFKVVAAISRSGGILALVENNDGGGS